MKKRFFPLFLVLVLCVGLFPAPVHADTHTHGDGWTAWTDPKSLPSTAGNYYLTTDVTVSGVQHLAWSAPSGVTRICLEGHTINWYNSKYSNYNRNIMRVYSGSELHIYDKDDNSGKITGGAATWQRSDPNEFYWWHGGGVFVDGGRFYLHGGQITGNGAVAGGGVEVTNGGYFEMSGGVISDNTADGTNWPFAGGVQVEGGSTFTMTGGTITGNHDYWNGQEYVRRWGVYISADSTFNVSGDVNITGNVGEYNVLLGEGVKINVTGPLSEDARIGVTTWNKTEEGNTTAITTGLPGNGTLSNFICNQNEKDKNANNGFRLSGGNIEAFYGTPYTVSVTAGDHMTKTDKSGAASQTVVGTMIDVEYTAEDCYAFPADYESLGTTSGVTVTRVDANKIRISGTPTENVNFVLGTAQPVEDLYPLWIGGVRIRESNKDDITSSISAAYPGSASGTAAYDPDKNELTLDGFTLTNQSGGTLPRDYQGIYYEGTAPLSVVLNGNSAVTSRSTADTNTAALQTTADVAFTGSGKLVLTGADTSGYGYTYGINCKRVTVDGPTVELYGGTSAGGYSYGLYGDLDLKSGTVKAIAGTATSYYSYGIYGNAAVAGGSLTAGGGTSYYSNTGIYGGLTLDDGTVDVQIGTNTNTSSGYDCRGIYSTSTVNGGSLTITGGSSPRGSVIGVYNQLNVTDGTVRIETGDAPNDNICVNGYLYVGKDGESSDASVTLIAGSAGDESTGVNSTVTVYGGTLDVTAGSSTSTSNGVWGTFYLYGGATRIVSGTAPYSYAVNGTPYFYRSGSLELIAGDGSTASQATTNAVYVSSDSKTEVDVVSPNPDGSSPVPYVKEDYAQYRYLKTGLSYNLWVGDTRVTEKNASDVFNDGTVSFDAATATLRLNGATLNASGARATIEYGDHDLGALTIECTGANTLNYAGTGRYNVYNDAYDNNNSKYYPLTVKLQNGASLDLSAAAVSSGSGVYPYGIYTPGELVIDGAGTVNATGADLTGTALGAGAGVYCYDLTLSGGAVLNATGGDCDGVYNDRMSDSYGVQIEGGDLTIGDGSKLNASGGSVIGSNNSSYPAVSAGLVMRPEHTVTLSGTGKALVTGGTFNGSGYGGSYGLFLLGWDPGAVTFVTNGGNTSFDMRGGSAHSAIYYIYGNYSFARDPEKTDLTTFESADSTTGTEAVDSTVSFYGRNAADKRILITGRAVYSVAITAGTGMTPAAAYNETVKGPDAMTAQTYTADEGYYFPTDYTGAAQNGVTVTRDSYTEITVSGTPTADVDLTLPAAIAKTVLPTPAATFVADGADSGVLTIQAAGSYQAVYKDSSGGDTGMYTVQAQANDWPVNKIGPGTMTVRAVPDLLDADAQATKLQSAPLEITVTKPDKPAVSSTNCTTEDNNDGTITGVTAAMEYSEDGTNWTDGTGADLTDLVPGTYYVRVKAAGTALASDTLRLSISGFNTYVPEDEPNLEIVDATEQHADEYPDETVFERTSPYYQTAEQEYTIPYEPKEDENPKRVTVSKVGADGELVKLDAEYDEEAGGYVVRDDGTTATYVVGYAPFPYEDVQEDDWYYDAVDWADVEGITEGTEETLFEPETKTSRADAVTLLWRAAGSPEPAGTACPFTDVPADAYYAKAVLWAYENGITEGVADDLFGSDDPVTRADFAVFLYRYIQSTGGGFTGLWAFPLNFEDAALVPDYAYEAFCWLVMNGIVEGDGGNLMPLRDCFRCEAVTMLFRAFGE